MYLIGICGPSCSGKSKAAYEISKSFKQDVIIINQDSYYFGGNSEKNYDVPESIDFDLLIHHLEELLSGKEIEVPVYDFKTHSRLNETKTIKPRKIIILEGILIFTQKKLRDLMSLKVYISTHGEISFSRRIHRDINERKRSIEEITERYFRDVLPSCKTYVEPSEIYADIVLKNNIQDQFIGLKILIDHIRVTLKI